MSPGHTESIRHDGVSARCERERGWLSDLGHEYEQTAMEARRRRVCVVLAHGNMVAWQHGRMATWSHGNV